MLPIGVLLALILPFIPVPATAVMCAGLDDTAAIQAELDLARAQRGGVVTLPLGTCRTRALNGRDLIGVRIEGVTSYGTIVTPLESDGILLDLTNSYDVTLTRFTLGNTMTQPGANAAVPRVGLLTAQSSLTAPSSNLIHLDQLVVSGTFGWAAWLNLGVASSTVMRSQFYNFMGGLGTVVFVAHNWMGLVSPFGPLMAGNSAPTDWTFVGSEIHNFGHGAALWLGGADSLRFFGGNMSVNMGFPWFVTVNVAGITATGPNIIFDGTTFYTDDGTRPQCLIQSNQGAFSASLRAVYSDLPWFC